VAMSPAQLSFFHSLSSVQTVNSPDLDWFNILL
jgi:hypothetical protein